VASPCHIFSSLYSSLHQATPAHPMASIAETLSRDPPYTSAHGPWQHTRAHPLLLLPCRKPSPISPRFLLHAYVQGRAMATHLSSTSANIPASSSVKSSSRRPPPRLPSPPSSAIDNHFSTIAMAELLPSPSQVLSYSLSLYTYLGVFN